MKQCLLVLTIDKSIREWENDKKGKGSKSQPKEMIILARNGSDIIQGTSHEVGNWNCEELLLGTW